MLLTACGDRNEGGNRGNVSTGGSADNSFIEAYRFLPEFIDIDHVSGFVSNTIIHNDLIYFCYVIEPVRFSDDIFTDDSITEPTEDHRHAKIVIESMQPDGTQVSKIEIPISFDSAVIATMHINTQNDFALILSGITFRESGYDSTLLYLEYTSQGIEVISREITGINSQPGSYFFINDAYITNDGDILLLTGETEKATVYILNEQLSIRGQMEVAHVYSTTKTIDGRIIISDTIRSIDATRTVLREVDFSSGDWGEIHTIDVSGIRDIYTAGKEDPFDIYIDDGSHLFGYNINTGNKTYILNWIETGIEITFNACLVISSDESLSFFINNRDLSTNTWQSEYVILNRIERTDEDEIQIITIALDSLHGKTLMQSKINAFNRQSQTHQIQAIEFQKLYDIYDENNTMTWFRFMIDLMTGNAPDILYGLGSSFDAMHERGLLVDLYPFIDSDPELNRSDFFPNILKALETPDGSLFEIPYEFTVDTMIGMVDIVGDIQSWTFAEMLALIESNENSDIQFILAQWITADVFIDMAIMFSGNDFIDWDNNKAYLDSEEFLKLLEISSHLPVTMPPADFNTPSPVTRLLRREQLFEIINLFNYEYYQMYTGMLGEDMVAIGMPTPDGGAHLVRSNGFSISANSNHKDEAWSFIREFLHPDLDLNIQFKQPQNLRDFPLRIDLFDEVIKAAKTQIFTTDEDGNEVEQPNGSRGMGDFMVDLYALTDAEERSLREIIENASLIYQSNEAIENMVKEELPPFLAGTRTAVDTARILQNRIQTYLNERS